MSKRMYQPYYSRNRGGFSLPTSSDISGWANLDGAFHDIGTNMKGGGVACGTYPPLCSGFIQPVVNSSNNICENSVNHVMSQVCGPLATAASEPCRSSSFCPSSVTTAIQDTVLRECNDLLPTSDVVCGFVDNLGRQAIDQCSGQLRTLSNCEGFRRSRGY